MVAPAFLLAFQAAGLVTSVYNARSQQKMIQLGRKLEKEQLSTNLEAIRLQSAESSLDEMKEVRQNIGSQIAVNAARGNRNDFSGINETSKAFENDERKRRMNLLAKESELRSANILSGLHSAQSETQLGQSLMKDFLNTVPLSSAFDSVSNSKKSRASNNTKTNTGLTEGWGY